MSLLKGAKRAALQGLLVICAVVLMLVTLPHVLEDFHYGELSRFGLSTLMGVAVLTLAYTGQLVGISLVLRGSVRGALLLALLGAIWCAGAVLIHGRELLFSGPDYRHGAISKALELFVIILGAWIAWLGWRVAKASQVQAGTSSPTLP